MSSQLDPLSFNLLPGLADCFFLREFSGLKRGGERLGHGGPEGSGCKFLGLMTQVKVSKSSFRRLPGPGEGRGDRGQAGAFPGQLTPRGAGICILFSPAPRTALPPPSAKRLA